MADLRTLRFELKDHWQDVIQHHLDGVPQRGSAWWVLDQAISELHDTIKTYRKGGGPVDPSVPTGPQAPELEEEDVLEKLYEVRNRLEREGVSDRSLEKTLKEIETKLKGKRASILCEDCRRKATPDLPSPRWFPSKAHPGQHLVKKFEQGMTFGEAVEDLREQFELYDVNKWKWEDAVEEFVEWRHEQLSTHPAKGTGLVEEELEKADQMLDWARVARRKRASTDGLWGLIEDWYENKVAPEIIDWLVRDFGASRVTDLTTQLAGTMMVLKMEGGVESEYGRFIVQTKLNWESKELEFRVVGFRGGEKDRLAYDVGINAEMSPADWIVDQLAKKVDY